MAPASGGGNDGAAREIRWYGQYELDEDIGDILPDTMFWFEMFRLKASFQASRYALSSLGATIHLAGPLPLGPGPSDDIAGGEDGGVGRAQLLVDGNEAQLIDLDASGVETEGFDPRAAPDRHQNGVGGEPGPVGAHHDLAAPSVSTATAPVGGDVDALVGEDPTHPGGQLGLGTGGQADRRTVQKEGVRFIYRRRSSPTVRIGVVTLSPEQRTEVLAERRRQKSEADSLRRKAAHRARYGLSPATPDAEAEPSPC